MIIRKATSNTQISVDGYYYLFSYLIPLHSQNHPKEQELLLPQQHGQAV